MELPVLVTLAGILEYMFFTFQVGDVLVESTRVWVEGMKELGMQHEYIEIPGGDHSLVISENRDNMARVFEYMVQFEKDGA